MIHSICFKTDDFCLDCVIQQEAKVDNFGRNQFRRLEALAESRITREPNITVSSASENWRKNRIYRRSPMQTEKSQPEGKGIMPERRFTEFPALSVDSRVGISRSA